MTPLEGSLSRKVETPTEQKVKMKTPSRRKKRPELQSRTLIGPAGSMMFFLTTREARIVKDVRGELMEQWVPKHFPVRMTRARLDGVPAIAGGCSLEVTTHMAKEAQMPYDDLVERIRDHGGYGVRFVFIDDTAEDDQGYPFNERIISQLQSQAVMEADVHRETLEEAIMGSSLSESLSWEETHPEGSTVQLDQDGSVVKA